MYTRGGDGCVRRRSDRSVGAYTELAVSGAVGVFGSSHAAAVGAALFSGIGATIGNTLGNTVGNCRSQHNADNGPDGEVSAGEGLWAPSARSAPTQGVTQQDLAGDAQRTRRGNLRTCLSFALRAAVMPSNMRLHAPTAANAAAPRSSR